MSELDKLMSYDIETPQEDTSVCPQCGKVPCESFIGRACSNMPTPTWQTWTTSGTTGFATSGPTGYYDQNYEKFQFNKTQLKTLQKHVQDAAINELNRVNKQQVAEQWAAQANDLNPKLDWFEGLNNE